MAREYKSKKDGAEQSAPVQKKYEYKICRGAWNGKTRERDGCGKLFTMDSVIEYCPECGIRLSHIRYGSPATERVSRIHTEKCEKCANSVNALPCFCRKPPKPEYCVPCKCRECCRKQSALADEAVKSGHPLLYLMREYYRKRKEEREKADEAERKAQAEKGVFFAETEKKPGPAFKTVGQILEDEIP
jgi:hypothetical protein